MGRFENGSEHKPVLEVGGATKTCSKCKEVKPISAFSKQSDKKDGLRANCKKCISDRAKSEEGRAVTKAYVKNNIDKVRELRRNFYHRHKEKLSEKGKVFREKNKEKLKEKSRQYREKNRDALLERHRRYNEKNKETKLEYMRNRYSERRDEILGKNKVATKKWRQANKHALCAKTAKYLADKKKATPAWANFVAIKDIYKEAEKRRSETDDEWHVDHIVPLNSKLVCGLHCEANLQILHYAENVRKSNKHWPDMP